MNIRASINMLTLWSQSETNPNNAQNIISDEGRLSYQQSYSSGTGYGQINSLYHEIGVLPANSGVKYYDLLAMTGSIFGLSFVKSFDYIKSLSIKNISSSSDAVLDIITYQGSGFDNWFGNPTGSIEISISGVEHKNTLGNDYAVSSSERFIRLENTTSIACKYELTVLGIE